MFATYRIDLSPSMYGSEGSLTIQNVVQLPNNKYSLHTFTALILKDIKETLPRSFETFLTTTKLREELSQRLSEEASLLTSKPEEAEIEKVFSGDLEFESELTLTSVGLEKGKDF